METQEYLFIPDEIDREFTEMDGNISLLHPDYAAVPEEKRRVAYFLVSRIGTRKMPEIAQMAKVSTGKCYDLIKDQACRIAQDIASQYLRNVQERKFQDDVNQATCKIARLAREKKLLPAAFSGDMTRICKLASDCFKFTPIEFYYLDLNSDFYRVGCHVMAGDKDRLANVNAQLKEIEQCSHKDS